jgi:hypothetical protein
MYKGYSMKIIYLSGFFIIFHNLIINQLQASDHQNLSSISNVFIIPTFGKNIDYSKIQSPLNFLSSSNSCDISDTEKLSIISTKVSTLLQCPLIQQYNQKEQHKLEIIVSLVQQKIECLSHEKYKKNPRLELFNHDHNEKLTHEKLHQYMLVKRIFDLQKYKNDTDVRFLQKL